MSAGEDIERAHKLAAQACGLMSYMLTKRRVSRELLQATSVQIEDTAKIIKSLLTPSGGDVRVGVPTNEDVKNGSEDTSG